MPQRGVSGNRPLWGMMETGEHVAALQGASGQSIFAQMRRSDGQIGAVLKAITLPVIRAYYYVEPASDAPQDIEIAEFVEDNLLRRMSMSWHDTLRQVMLMKPHGFSVFEKLYMRSDDGRVRLRKLDPRLPWSVDRWNFDGDTLKSIEQVGSDGQRYTIPIGKAVVFTEGREGDNWEGTSALRTVYGLWKIKNVMLEVAAIKHDRFGVGVPVVTEPENAAIVDEQREAIDEWLEDLHADERTFLRLPAGWSFELMSIANDNVKTEEFIEKLNSQIATALLAQFLTLGTSESGNRALGESFVSFFLLAMQETADYIADVMTRFVVRELVGYNWEVSEYPRLKAGDISELDPESLAALVTAGVIRHDIDLENSVRGQLGLPDATQDDSAVDSPGPQPEAEPTDEEPQDEVDEEPEDEPEETRAAFVHTFAAQLPEQISGIINPDVQAAELDAATESTLDQVLAIRARQIDRVITDIVAGKKLAQVTVPAGGDMYEVLVSAFREQRDVGRAQVLEEVSRQRPDMELADPVYGDELQRLLFEEFSLRVEGAGSKLKSTVAQTALDLRKAGYVGDALRAELERRVPERLSERTWADLTRSAVNQGWGFGREQALRRLGDEVDYYYRSGILDNNICAVCRPKDGMTVTPDMQEFHVPDPGCEGGPNCRCEVVAVMKSEGRGEE